MNTQLPASERAFALLLELSTQEKMAQLNCYLPQKGHPDGVTRDCPGGVGHISCLEMRSMETLEEAAAFQRKIQENVMALSGHHIPAIFHMEGLCGAYLQGAASFPSGIGRASSWDPALEEKGASPADLRLKGSFCIEGSGFVEGKKRAFYARAGISSGAPL